MIEARRKVADYCGILTAKANEAAISGGTLEKIAAIAEDACEKQLVVPIVGEFSSGKSTLINNLLGEDILPVAITPETSLATELHYSPENYILAVKRNSSGESDSGETDRYQISEIKTLTEKAADYIYAQVYLNNENLRQLEPLVLVDMPGFNSPRDVHNDALDAYLARGCYYIALSSANAGTITKSLERRLHGIEGLKREFSFFLSKADNCPKDTLDNLVAYFQNQLNAKFKNAPKVAYFGMSADEVMHCLKGIDAHALFLNLYREMLLDVCNDIIANINLQIKTAKIDGEKLRSVLDELKRSVEKIRKKETSDIEEMRDRYSGNFINEIVGDVKSALKDSLDELTGIARSGNQESLKRCVDEIVRSALNASVRKRLEGINQEITVDLSKSMQDLNITMKNLDFGDNYLQDLSAKVSGTLMAFGDMMSRSQSKFDTDSQESSGQMALTNDSANPDEPMNPILKTTLLGGGTAALGLGIASTVSIAVPIIGIVAMLLPLIFSFFKGMNGPQNKDAEIRAKLTDEIFPQILSTIRYEIPVKIQDHIQKMINGASEQIAAHISNQIEAINTQMAQKNENAADNEAALQKLQTVLADVQNTAGEIITWGKK
ncbi:MAG: dynamin family protein [Treponema sp.]|nr:dynamin family protein [Treponema sp.]